jgi:RNA polymerase-associated protein RTF1
LLFLYVSYEFRPEKKNAPVKKPELEPDDMEESDDDDSSSEEEFDMDMENLDQNQLIKDEEDRKYLESLPEIEREAILAERFEQRKNEHDMRKALREAKQKKREEKREALGLKEAKRKTPAKKVTKKKGETSKDEEIAKSLTRRSSTRDRDATRKKDSKTKALAKLREVRTHLSLGSKTNVVAYMATL